MFKALGVYIFAGGQTQGIKEHFEVLAHFEDGNFGVAAAQLNFPGLPIYAVQPTWPWQQYVDKVDWLYGNPPCAPWSMSNASDQKLDGWTYKEDPRTHCVLRQFDLLEKIRPTVWSWECVLAALKRGRELIDELSERAAVLGYATTLLALDGLDCGIPQSRKRLFTIFHKVLLPFDRPNVTGPRTLREAFAIPPLVDIPESEMELQKISDAKLAILRLTKPGRGLDQTFNELYPNQVELERTSMGRIKGRPGFLNQRLSLDKPCKTITGGSGCLFHPVFDRSISVQEAKAFGGYPQSFHVRGSVNSKFAELFKAVMPPVANWLAARVKSALIENKPATAGTFEIHNYAT